MPAGKNNSCPSLREGDGGGVLEVQKVVTCQAGEGGCCRGGVRAARSEEWWWGVELAGKQVCSHRWQGSPAVEPTGSPGGGGELDRSRGQRPREKFAAGKEKPCPLQPEV